MIKLFLHLSPIKRFLVLTFLLIGFSLILFSQIIELSPYIINNTNMLSDQLALIPEKDLILIFLCILAITSSISLLHYYEIKELKETLKQTMTEKKLDQHFPQLFQGQTFHEISKNIETTFHLLKSFDIMKSTKINLEVSTLKVLISHIEEGILFVDKDKIVTHINQIGEHFFKLIPGEIIHQSISRKIHSPILLESIELCLNEEKKIINKIIYIGDETPLLCSIIPIRNKQNNAIRALILVKKTLNTPKQENDATSLNS